MLKHLKVFEPLQIARIEVFDAPARTCDLLTCVSESTSESRLETDIIESAYLSFPHPKSKDDDTIGSEDI